MKLLLDEMKVVEDIALLHTVQELGKEPYIKRRSFRSPRHAARLFFEYGDIMSSAGYTIVNVLERPWYYEIQIDERIVETVELLWPRRDWSDEMNLLEQDK